MADEAQGSNVVPLPVKPAGQVWPRASEIAKGYFKAVGLQAMFNSSPVRAAEGGGVVMCTEAAILAHLATIANITIDEMIRASEDPIAEKKP